MRNIATAALAGLVGCATSGAQMQAECEQAFTAFADIYRCTKDAIGNRRPDILRDPRAKLYLLKGEQLAVQVREGAISDLDARVAWQQLFVTLKHQADTEVLQVLGAMPKPAAPVNCTAVTSGGVTRTACQ